MSKKIEHIGIAVHNLQESIRNYQKILGIKCTSQEEVKDQQVKVGMIPLQYITIELLMPTHEDSPLTKFLKKRGEGIHHLALRVENLDKELKRLQNENVRLIDKVPRVGAHGTKIAFIHPQSMGGVLVELVEKEK